MASGSQAQVGIGDSFAHSDDYDEAVKWYRRAAEQGHAEAQLKLGLCLSDGKGVEKDHFQAFEWFSRAAEHEKKTPNATFQLAYSYHQGLGVEEDLTKAFELFETAADQGLAEAQYNLGVCYHNGDGVNQSYYDAVLCFYGSAEKGCAQAQYEIGLRYHHGDGVGKNKDHAVKYLRLAALQSHTDAYKALTKLMKDGLDIGGDLPQPTTPSRDDAHLHMLTLGSRACSQCGKAEDPSSPLKRCGGCQCVRYCSVECQREHWKKGHKKDCKIERM